MELPVISNAAIPNSGCRSGATADRGALAHLPDHIRVRVQDHPCYSEEAHHYFARMHVAVAPACNIQCNYCNRKYDCSNESRPGVVSELLTPEQAVKKTLAVAAAIPQMTVLGIAGPGDPLANPERTFATFRMLSAQAPDIRLCVSTNGLSLPDAVEELARHNIDHVTITINCVDPEIGARIYPWIFWNKRRIRGVEGARILIEQQQKGLEMLAARGMLVKVNSVMIPGVNDEHLQDVSKIVKAKGAFLHNVMPLIAQASHGTYYGLTGQREPTQFELQALQDVCAGDMAMMRHCRQCRADAVGLLGEDRGEEFTLDKIDAMEIDYGAAMAERARVREAITAELEMKRALKAVPKFEEAATREETTTRNLRVAVATKGGGLVNEHFGHAREFLIYEAGPGECRFLGHRKCTPYCMGDESCGDGETVLGQIIAALEGVEVVLASKIGFEPWNGLESAGIRPNGEHAMEPIEEAIRMVYDEMAAAGKLDTVVVDTVARAA
ncbi:MAG: nitrogenase cofactor biosynthesis protein NifB [Azoarcus sp.]|jgi:nitrogen fixation protein NifB|nr:nitrogenase cofactor biosynthesis protein NifB [Azoarcus sp.]